jgi:hypothetical protein
MTGYSWMRRVVVIGSVLAAGAAGMVAFGAVDSRAGRSTDGATPGVAPVASRASEASKGPASVVIPPASTPMPHAIRLIQDQAANALASNPAVEPHDALGGPPAFPAGFDFDAAVPPATSPSECTKAKRIICVDKTTYIATVYESGKPQWSFYVRPGDARGARYRTGEGYGRISHKSRNHISSIYGTPMPYAMFITWEKYPVTGEAFHLSYQFQSEGYFGASHGCMGVGSEAAMKRLWDSTPAGTRVFVYRT